MGLQIIGISGKAGSGKDYLANTYLRPLGFRPIALADQIKALAVGRGHCTYQEAWHTKPPEVRKLLQQLGTELGRNTFHENVWVDTLGAWLELFGEKWGEERFVVTDVRFPNEVEGIQKLGGFVVRMWAPDRVADNGMPDALRLHPSETALDAFDPLVDPQGNPYYDLGLNDRFFDAVIDNRRGREEGVPFQLTAILKVNDIIPVDAPIVGTQRPDTTTDALVTGAALSSADVAPPPPIEVKTQGLTPREAADMAMLLNHNFDYVPTGSGE